MTEQDFPFLYVNRKAHVRGLPSFNRLVRVAMRKFMLFVVRLHYATHVASIGGVELPLTKDAWVFTFDMFPQLKTVLTKVERELKKMHSKSGGGDIAKELQKHHVPHVASPTQDIAMDPTEARTRKFASPEYTEEVMEQSRAFGPIFYMRLQFSGLKEETNTSLLRISNAISGVQKIQDNLTQLEATFNEFVKQNTSATTQIIDEQMAQRRKEDFAAAVKANKTWIMGGMKKK